MSVPTPFVPVKALTGGESTTHPTPIAVHGEPLIEGGRAAADVTGSHATG